jgi:hypothetical protein
MAEDYDLILAGTSFASSFFLLEYLARAKSDARILVLERGQAHPHKWQLGKQQNSAIRSIET